jgi:hypothetical protein
LQRLRFSVRLRGARLRVDVDPDVVRYTLTDGPAIVIAHHDDEFRIEPGATVEFPLGGSTTARDEGDADRRVA